MGRKTKSDLLLNKSIPRQFSPQCRDNWRGHIMMHERTAISKKPEKIAKQAATQITQIPCWHNSVIIRKKITQKEAEFAGG